MAVRTNPPSRPSRLYRGVGTYLRKSIVTIFRIYTLYKPLKTFFLIGALLIFAGAAIGMRFLWFFFEGDRGGHVQSLILAAVFLIIALIAALLGFGGVAAIERGQAGDKPRGMPLHHPRSSRNGREKRPLMMRHPRGKRQRFSAKSGKF